MERHLQTLVGDPEQWQTLIADDIVWESFSTCVDVAVGRDAAILPYRWNNASAESSAASQLAELARPRGQKALQPTTADAIMSRRG